MLLHGNFRVDVLGFVIVLFQIGVFERVFVFVVVAIRVCFGWCFRLRYRAVSE